VDSRSYPGDGEYDRLVVYSTFDSAERLPPS
jgi:hypothetical protein